MLILNDVPLSQISSLPPLQGVIPNFTNPPSIAPILIFFDPVFPTLMVIAVLIRIYRKGFIARSLGWDDCK